MNKPYEPYKDWIVRYYASHDDIPPGHTDGELTELIRCKDCKYYREGECWYENDNDGWEYYQSVIVIENPLPDDFCSRAERKDNGADKRRR